MSVRDTRHGDVCRLLVPIFVLFCGACTTLPNADGVVNDSVIGARDSSGLNANELQQLVTAMGTEAAGELVSEADDSVDGKSPAIHQIVTGRYPSLSPRIVVPRRRLQCVPYARMVSGIQIYGNAGTWWRRARGRYQRGKSPSAGAVLAMQGNRRARLGHVAVVTHVLSSREIVVNHANWLNRERIHLGTPVVDVSPRNDWSSVRVWYTPGNRYGASVYRAHGFIYPKGPKLFTTVANANIRRRPSARATRITTLPRRTMIEVIEKVVGEPWYRIARSGEVLGYVYAPLVRPLS